MEEPGFFKELKQGFEVFNPGQSEHTLEAPAVTRSAIQVLNGTLAQTTRPFFLWVHYIDPHDPYKKHLEFDFGPESIDRYDGEIAYSDAAAGRLVSELERSGRLENTIVVAFADHGEEFNEHGGRFHNGSVYDEQIRVPLLIRVPGMKGRRIRCPVSLLDLVPTMTDLLAIDDPAPRHGRSLVPTMLGMDDPGMAYAEVFTTKETGARRRVRTVIVGDTKLIERADEGRFEMYDLARDPQERESLIGSGAPMEGTLAAVLAAWNEAIDRPFSGPPALPLSDRLDALLGRVSDPSIPAAREALGELRSHLLSPYGLVRATSRSTLPERDSKIVFDRLAAMAPRVTDPALQRSIVEMLGDCEPCGYGEVLRKIAGDEAAHGETRLAAAIALARLGDEAALPVLAKAAELPDSFNKADVGWALVRFGRADALAWYRAALEVPRWGSTLRLAMESLAKLGPVLPKFPGLADASPARFVRNRVFGEVSRHFEVNLALVEGVRGAKDEDSLLILLRLLRCQDDVVRAAARAALEEVMPTEEIERNRAAMDDEIDADSARIALETDVAVASYRAALAKGGLRNVGARFRLARTLRLGNRDGEAKLVLEEIERIAPMEIDRALARRRIGRLAWPLGRNQARWKATVLEARLPEPFRPGSWFLASFRIRNDGDDVWPPGWRSDSDEICIRFLDANGALVETDEDRYLLNQLPEEGVNPGEEITVSVLGAAPATEDRGRMALLFRNGQMEYPQGAVVWTESRPTSAPASQPTPR